MEKGKMRKMLLTLVIIGLVLGQVTAAYAAFIVPRLEVSIHNTNLEAGRKNNVIIKATNSGSLSLTEVEIILTSVSPLIFIVEGNHKVLNEILKESSQNYTAVVYVDQNAPSGAYTIQAQLKYVRYDETISLTVPLSVIVEKTFQPMLRLSVNPASQTLRNGYEGDFNYSLENTAKIELHNINIALTSSSPLVIINSDQNLEFSKILPDEKLNLSTKIRIISSTPIGPYSIMAIVQYSDKDGNRYKQQGNLPFEVLIKSPVITAVNLDPTMTVRPGNTFTMELLIECFDANANNVRAQLTLDSRGLVTPRSPTTISLGDLTPGDKLRVKYDLLLNGAATPGEVSLALTVRFIEPTGVPSSMTEAITLSVSEFVEFQLLQQEVFKVEQGKRAEIESDLLLIGTTKVEFTNVELIQTTPFIMDSGSQEYLGAIDPDSPVPFTVAFDVPSETETGRYTIPLKIRYLDNWNKVTEKTIDLSIEVVKKTASQTTTQDEGIWGWLKTILGLRF